MWGIFFAGIGIMLVVTWGLRAVIYCSSGNKIKLGELVNSFFLSFLTCLISLDYSLARKAKEKIKASFPESDPPAPGEQYSEAAKARGKYIALANTINLIASVVLSIGVIVARYRCNIEWLYFSLFGLIGYRLLSRTVEINVAFFNDCLDKKKNSDLDKYDRIKLAFTSLLEEAFLFAALYSFAKLEWWRSLLGGLHSFILSPFSLGFRSHPLFAFVAVYQVICTIVLITISFATYISTPDNAGKGKGNEADGNGGNDENDNNGGNSVGDCATETAAATENATASAKATVKAAAAPVDPPSNATATAAIVGIVGIVAFATLALLKRR